MTLIEVLVAVLIVAVGVLGAALIQLKALKYTDSAMLNSQASFIAYDLFDRMRANPQADYRLASLDAAPSMGNLAVPREQDLFDFARQVRQMGGERAGAMISLNEGIATVVITWGDARAAGASSPDQTFALSSRVSSDPQVSP